MVRKTRKFNLGNSPDFLIEKEVEHTDVTEENLEVITGRGQGKKDGTPDYCTQTRKVAYI